jgi:hypothetical protein
MWRGPTRSIRQALYGQRCQMHLGPTAWPLERKLRTNPRKAWYQNLAEVTAASEFIATFHLQHPQPALIALLAGRFGNG